MSVEVLLTDGAARDLDELYAVRYDLSGAQEADLFLDHIQDALDRLAETPLAGQPLGIVARFGLHAARQLRDGPWRILYRLAGERLYVDAIAHERRSFQSLLERRLLDA